MKIPTSVIALSCAGLVSSAFAGPAPLAITDGLTDAQVNALTAGLIVWEAEGRFGDRGGAGERELGVGASTAQAQADEAQVNWTNDSAMALPAGYAGYDYELNWDGVDTLTLDVDGVEADGSLLDETLVYVLPAPERVTDLFIRVAGNDVSTSALSWGIDGEVGTLIAGEGAMSDSIQTRISGSPLEDGFTLSGTFTFAWSDIDGTRNSRPSWQIKAATPAPGAAALFGAAGVLTLRRRRG